MTTREFLTNVTFILTVMAVAALLEIAVPFFAAKRDRERRTANLCLTAVSFLSNWLLASIAAILALTLRPTGMMAVLQWPLAAQVAIGVIALDFSVGYLSHRTGCWEFPRRRSSSSGCCRPRGA